MCFMCNSDRGPVRYKGEDALVEVLEKHKRLARSRGAAYDCMVPVSGGKDSMYALYSLVTRYNVKPLAFNYSQGFVDPQAAENLENGVRILKVDLIRNLDNKAQHRYLRHNLMELSKGKRSQRRLASLLCTGCAGGYVNAAERVARDHRLTLIIQGGCPVETHIDSYLTDDVRRSWRRPSIGLAWKELREFVGNPELFMDVRYPRNIDRMSTIRGLLRRFSPQRKPKDSLTRIHYFDYMPWDDRSIVAELERDIAWHRPPGRHTTMRFDCRLHILVDRFRILYQGFSEKEAIFSAMVRKDMLTREEALAKAEQEIAEDEMLVDTVIEDVVRTVGLEHRLDEVRRLWHP
jgi:hypothetical protein